MVLRVLLQCKCRTAGTAGGPEREDLPLIDIWWVFWLQVSPQEPQQWFVFLEQLHLMEHPADVTAKGEGMLSEAEKHIEQ